MMSGEATPSQMGGFLMALRVRGETVDEITGAVATMRAKMQRVAAPPDAIDVVGTGGDASGTYNISTCAALHRRRRRRSGRQARQPRAVLALGRGRRARRARRQDRPAAGRDRALHLRGRHRLHVRAGASSGDEACRPDPRRARHAHHLQPARAALQSGRREAADGRRVLAPMGRAARQCAEELSAPSAPGWCTARTGSTRSPPPAPTRSRRWRTAR